MNLDRQQQQPSSSLLDAYESSENALMDSFKAAALKVTTLYKDSLVQNRKAYASGYQQALQDLYEFISSHPSTTVSQQEAFVAPTEQGLLPVQDLLAYARQRNGQLASEMGMDPPSTSNLSNTSTQRQQHHQPTSTAATFDSTNIRSPHQHSFHSSNGPSPSDHEAMESGSASVTSSPSHTESTPAHIRKTASVPGVIGAAVKNAFHPFQIDPNTQFTFSLPTNYNPYGQPWLSSNTHHQNTSNHPFFMNNYNNINGNSNYNEGECMSDVSHDSNNNNQGLDMDGIPMEGLKRRITPTELTFMGRSLNSMNIDSTWNEHVTKRRSKRDE